MESPDSDVYPGDQRSTKMLHSVLILFYFFPLFPPNPIVSKVNGNRPKYRNFYILVCLDYSLYVITKKINPLPEMSY